MPTKGSEHDSLLRPSRLKIERAKKHIRDLGSLIDDFFAERPFELWSRIVKNPYQREIFVKQKKPIPDEIPLILGDAIHNLKSALDILAFGLVGDKAPRPERVLFPFATTANGLDGSIANRQIHLAGEKVIDALKRLKPYAGGDKFLYGIQTLDTQDKHHFIITVGQVADITGDQLGLLLGGMVSGSGVLRANTPIGDAIIVQPIRGTRAQKRRIRRTEFQEDFQPAFAICFGPEQGFDSQPVITTLRLMTGAAENAVQEIANAFSDRA